MSSSGILVQALCARFYEGTIESVDEVFQLATALRERHGKPDDRVSFTHVRCRLNPAAVLDQLRASSLAPLIAPEGTLLTHPERPGYGPIAPVVVAEHHLSEVWVRASTWAPPTWDFTRGELAFRLIYRQGEAAAQSQLSLSTREGQAPRLTRVAYDNQRAATGYDGEDRVSADATPEQVSDFLDIVRAATAS